MQNQNYYTFSFESMKKIKREKSKKSVQKFKRKDR